MAPPAESAYCAYGADWTAAKLRWKLTADEAAKDALLDVAKVCTDTVVEFEEAAEWSSPAQREAARRRLSSSQHRGRRLLHNGS
ncbi:hypothetical protein [Streptomyces atroolivaceus]|uniref:hypothetical protein n=1 Tax=Streptomyces atroolivaceus TaxID=66869 RepID=UPI00363B5B56